MIRKPVLLLVGVAALVLLVARFADRQGGSETEGDAARRASVEALGFLDRDSTLAAQLALAGERLDPNPSAEMAMLAVASHSAGIERVIDPGGAPVTAAIREESTVVTAGADRMLRTWRPSSGALLGQVRTAAPLSALADSFPGQSLAGATAQGGIVLIDISNPHTPRLRQVGPVLPTGERLLALSYGASGADLLVLGAGGTIVRVDSNTGRVISSWSLQEIGLANGEPATGALAAASFEVDFLGKEQLLLGTTTGAVVSVDMRTRHAHRLLGPGSAPGRITSVAREPYGYPLLVAGATDGAVSVFEAGVEPSISRGQPITAVASDEAGDTWLGSGEGIEVMREEGIPTETRVGEPVSQLSKGSGGILAITRRGKVELLGSADTGLALKEALSTSALAFEPNGYLLAAEGLDAGHIERLVALDPGHKREGGETVFNPEIRDYRPDPHWWPYAEEGTGLYVSDIVADSSFVAATGQDPTGAVAVLVWDRKSGRPLHRLTLGAGSIEPDQHGIVSDLVLLPGRHMIAAYSAVQQLVVVWSTDTWRRIATIPVGISGGLSLSPDESTLAVATLSESAEAGDIGNAPSKLVLIDTGSWRVEREVRTPDTYRVAWSPDGSRIATIGSDGMLRFWSADASEEAQQPLQLEGTPSAIAWRPDGRALAVSLEPAGVVIVDPNSRETFFGLPGSSVSSPLAWSPDGSLLAAAIPKPAEEEGEYGTSEPAQIWTLGAARLARRMCQLAGAPISSADWRQLVDPSIPPRPLCPRPKSAAPQSSDEQQAPPVLAYQSGHGVFVSDESGLVTRVGSVKEETYPPISFAWSPQGLAWLGSDQVDVLPDGSQRASWWPCHCAGIAWIEGSAFALSSDGGEMLRFTPGVRWPSRVAVEGSLGREPRVLGSLGDRLVVAGYLGMPARGTPNALFLVAQDGSVSRVRGAIEGVLTSPTATAPAGDEVAFISSRSGGACYFSSKVGILSLGPGGRPELRFPPMPGHAWLKVVASLQIDSAGTVSGTFGRFGCVDNESPPAPPSGERFELHDMTWTPTGERGGDVQQTGKVTAVVSPEQSFGAGGKLTLETPSGSTAVADSVTNLSVRP
jgi:WD40 repeat protein